MAATDDYFHRRSICQLFFFFTCFVYKMFGLNQKSLLSKKRPENIHIFKNVESEISDVLIE